MKMGTNEVNEAIRKAILENTGDTITIHEAALMTGKQDVYIHQLVIKGKLTAEKATVPGTNVPRWNVEKASVLAYFNGGSKHTSRTDGRNKWVIYMTKAELVAVRALLSNNKLAEVALSIVPANDYEKMKAYQAKRKAAKAPSAIKTQAALVIAEVKAAHPFTPAVEMSTPSAGARAAARAKR
jgi:hypothetical protein